MISRTIMENVVVHNIVLRDNNIFSPETTLN